VGDILVERLGEIRHYELVEASQERSLRKVDRRLFDSQLLGVNLKGVRW
jgi:hypothetical protein